MLRKIKKYLLISLVFSLSLSSFCGVLSPSVFSLVQAQSLQEKMEAKKKELAELERQIDEQKAKIKETQSEKDTLKRSLDALTAQIKKTGLELKSVQTELDTVNLKIDDINAELVRKEQELEKQNKLLALVIRTIYKEGDVGVLEIIATAESLSDILTYLGYLDAIKDRKEALILEIQAIKESLAEDRALLEQERAAAEKLKEKIEVKKQQLEEEEQTKKTLLVQVRKEEADYQGQLENYEQYQEELKEAVKEIENEIARQAALAQSRGGKLDPNAQFVWPAAAGYVTMEFGQYYPEYVYRIYPYLRNVNGGRHTGLDIAAPIGTHIYAADSGTVIFRYSYRYGYGNMLIIDHGGGLISLYGHLNGFNVSQGQKVEQGQVIAYMGSTGTSTGSHLHFETRLNGALVNPRNFM